MKTMKSQWALLRVVGGLAIAALVAVTLVSASACVVAGGGGIWVATAPPPPIMEVRVAPPGPDFIWIPGYYDYRGEGYIWVAGRWARPPHPRAEWVPDRWERHEKGYRHVKGHWRNGKGGREGR